jgi:hypothetical protein
VTQVHSGHYRNPQALPDGPALVVGGGNSGFQIAEELAATRQVDLSIAASYPMLPQRLAGKDLFWWLTRLRLMRVPANSRLGRRVRARGEFIIGTNRRQLGEGRGPVPTPAGRGRRAHRPVRRRQHPGRCQGGGLGDRLPVRLRLDPHPEVGRERPGCPPPRRHRRARPVLPGPVRGIDTAMPWWWVPACLGYDTVIGAYILIASCRQSPGNPPPPTIGAAQPPTGPTTACWNGWVPPIFRSGGSRTARSSPRPGSRPASTWPWPWREPGPR